MRHVDAVEARAGAPSQRVASMWSLTSSYCLCVAAARCSASARGTAVCAASAQSVQRQGTQEEGRGEAAAQERLSATRGGLAARERGTRAQAAGRGAMTARCVQQCSVAQ